MTRWGVLLPSFDPFRTGATPPVAQAAGLAEQAGFDAVWVGDHLLCPAPVLDAPLCLAVAATVTERVSLGFSVMLLGLRPPAWAAKQVATLQALSGSRIRLGVGAGGEFPQEFAAAGVPVGQRGRRLDAALTALPGLLDTLEPQVPRPPVLVGGRSDAALARAVRFGDAWLPMWTSAEALARRAERLGELAAEQGRTRPALALLVGVHVDGDETRGAREADGYLQGQYGMGLERVRRWTALGSAGPVAEFLHPYQEAGVSEFLLMALARRPLEQIERLAEVVAALR